MDVDVGNGHEFNDFISNFLGPFHRYMATGDR